MSRTHTWSQNVNQSCIRSATGSWPLSPPYYFRNSGQMMNSMLWQYVNMDAHWRCHAPAYCTRPKRKWSKGSTQAFIYRIASKYSNALRTSQTRSFAKWYYILHPKVAFEAPWSCACCGIKPIQDVTLHPSLNQCWKAHLFEYLAAIRYMCVDIRNAWDIPPQRRAPLPWRNLKRPFRNMPPWWLMFISCHSRRAFKSSGPYQQRSRLKVAHTCAVMLFSN